ncbi:hypothetical protein F0562_002351 [Nyssa sinensis]|uniref:SGNH hydrolase-type esterase domain-containing protein n=1 Tax=Nyssa sinensis TaxID=561372 RepID=A0A5J5C9E0_9ASTE|nr:hypothetical protein F0562_002351 [Nyssa sinensis]
MPTLVTMSSPSVFVTILAVALAVVIGTLAPQAEAARAFFVFGDSLVDNGNNNYLVTYARADAPPYGIDYPTHRPTGRFSNGLNIPDLISEALGSEPTLPYLSPQLNGQRLLVGANFASAGIGILNDTGIQFANILRIFQQLELFRLYQLRLSSLIGPSAAQQRVNSALVLITLGGNDFVNNYFLTPVTARRLQFTIPAFSSYLISEYRKVLMRLYELGARRVLVTGTGPLGCVPAELAMRSINGECAVEPQQAARIFNPELVQMLRGLNQELGSDVFVGVNTMEMQNDFIHNPQAYGFVTSKLACCGQGPYNGVGLCTIASNLCPNRDIYAFWDPFHPSTLAPQAEAARAFFVFGDSLVDNGNNNYLVTYARADAPPYGIDYPTHRPTGRFSNGLNIPDLISEALGSETTLPYLSPELNGQRLLVGANFASAGIGILNDTGIQFANIIRIFKQLELFQLYQLRLSALIGPAAAQQRVNSALVLITLGGNDFVNNYFLAPITARRLQFTIPAFSSYLISEYRKILMRLYELGARRVLVTGTGPLGCVPAELAMRSINGECAVEPQQAARIFNPELVQMLRGLNQELGSDVFVGVNTMEMQNDFIHNPQAYGFVTSKLACCGQGPYNGVGLCTIASNLCPNRDIYAFWDPFHPTERANRIIVRTILSGSDKYMNPMNLSTIMIMDSKN